MKAFTLLYPTSLAQAVAALPSGRDPSAAGRARVIAGGQDLLTELQEHLAEPELLVNVKRIPGLDRLERGADGTLSIGALVTIDVLAADEQVRRGWPAIAEAAASIASPQIRSLATVGGNLCQRPRCWYYRSEHAVCLKKGGTECYSYGGASKYNAILGGGPSYIVHPSDLAPALVAHEARVAIHGPEGERVLPLARFFTLPSEGDVTRENVLRPNEIVTRVEVPAPPADVRGTYVKFKERDSFDFALASVALLLKLEGERVAHARVCLGGVAPVPWRSPAAEAALTGQQAGEATWRAAAEAAVRGAEPLAHNAYKVPLAKGLVIKALRALSA